MMVEIYKNIGPPIPTSAYLRATTLGANWVYWPSGYDFGQAQRKSPSQATHDSHLDGVFYLLLHRQDTRNHGLPSHSTDIKSHG
jgi:hypothetical protein